MEQPAKPIAFKVRTQGRYNGKKGGAIKSGGGGAGALWYFDKTFTVATHQDQWVCVPTLTTSEQPDKTFHPATMNTPTPASTKPFRYLSVCSGMEAASVAWHPLGWTPAGFSEIEPFPAAILAHRFPNTTNHGDLTQHATWPIEPGTVDLLVGGTPCQSFSVAGLRKGLADPRGNLALTFLGLADRIRPRWIVWENVPGVLSSGGGRDFGSFLGALVELGYGFAYRVLDAQHFGVPQRRRRVFVVACAGDWRAPAEVLSLAEGLRGHLEAGGKKRKGPAADAGAGAEAGGLQRTVGTLCADTHPGAYSGQDAYTGRLIPSHWDGGPHPTLNQSAKGSGGVGSSNQELFSQGGAYLVPGEPIPIHDQATRHAGKRGDKQDGKGNGLGVGKPGDPAPTLTKGDKHAVGQPIPYRKAKRAQSTTDDETWVEGQVSNTLNNFDLGDTRTTHAVVEPSPVIIDRAAFNQGENAQYEPRIEAGEIMSTVIAKGPHAVGQPNTFQPGNLRRDAGADPSTEATTTLKASAGDQMPHVAYPINTLTLGGRPDPVNDARMTMGVGENGDPQFTLQAAHSHAVATAMAVRRLTPVECERLQGFPDNWSRIPWKGKPEEDCPDGPRYKACGNSMAVPVMAWIGRNIANHEAKQAR